ncbi:MAG: SBBP repeat-containing protein [candidate division KSB1 bacterium]|nr:SBBP repeat-containing protein [candidate division KSB1 bacterium]MDZ7335933.1 SBBP repeat-containing protein [candidate division KSB1 bacterium]MDZ7356794.1 SBBP repeat-containing protein [candidate division KSB1 bacterium]MDZ7375891.1 SBBP repeat-containing protein [candidate division KSB1 bacterium]MDZ7401247.1 SBBP repeat-containing protein [candidate division KSB1 bacterium]
MKTKLILISLMLIGSTTVTSTAMVKETWVRHFHSSNAQLDLAVAMALDDSSNVIVIGNSRTAHGDFDYLIVKYDSSGQLKWSAQYNGTNNGDDHAAAMAIDQQGNIYVTGSSAAANGLDDFVTIKLDRNGAQQWVARYNGPANNLDEATGVAVDQTGNVYVIGFSNAGGWVPFPDIVTIKYNSAGQQQWLARYDGSSGSMDMASAIAIDLEGNVYVTGATGSGRAGWGSAIQTDFITIKYNAQGQQVWAVTYNGPANSQDVATHLVLDAGNNVYVAGASTGNGTRLDYATLKYNNAGELQWVARYNSDENLQDNISGLAVDALGNVVVTGTIGSDLFNPNSDLVTVKYDQNGKQLWLARYNGPGNSWERAAGLALDRENNIYVTGQSMGDASGSDFVTLKYDRNGALQWAARYDSGSKSDDAGIAIQLDRSGDIYVAGSTGIEMNAGSVTIIKYEQNNNVIAANYSRKSDQRVSRNYPNPFNSTVTIIFDLPESSQVSLKVYNMMGQELAVLVDQSLFAGTHQVFWDATGQNSGIYFYRLKMNDKVESNKMILLR